MADEKDRLGDKLHDKERGEEDRYFRERERALLDKLKQQKAGAAGSVAAPHPKDDSSEAETAAGREKDSWLGRLVFRRRK